MKAIIEASKTGKKVVKANATHKDFEAYISLYKENGSLGRYMGSQPGCAHFENGLLVIEKK